MAYTPINTNDQHRTENFHYDPQFTQALKELRKIRKELRRMRKSQVESCDDLFPSLAPERRTRKRGVW